MAEPLLITDSISGLGVAITAWSIRIALLALAVCLAIELKGTRIRWWRFWRAAWSIGFLSAISHVVAAFHFYHGWSHHSAVVATQAETRDLLGWEFGFGIYFNYVFVLLWGTDVLVAWIAPSNNATRSPASSWARWLHPTTNVYLAFLAFQGSVVFASGPIRWVSLACTIAIFVLAVQSLRRAR